MRTRRDRIRHTIGFEVIGLIILSLGMSKLLGIDLGKIGILAVAFSIIATIWNYFYNILFDKALFKRTGKIHKTVTVRILHAVLFEFGLLFITIPIMAWWLQISLIEAVIMDLGMVVFYLIYAFIYNIIYDRIFPIPAIKADHFNK